jgi:hypothetical protein
MPSYTVSLTADSAVTSEKENTGAFDVVLLWFRPGYHEGGDCWRGDDAG